MLKRQRIGAEKNPSAKAEGFLFHGMGQMSNRIEGRLLSIENISEGSDRLED